LKYFQIISLLGFRWVLYRALYAAQIRLGLMEKRSPVRKWGELDCRITGKFFTDFENFPEYKPAVKRADQIIAGKFVYFSKHEKKLSFPPNWFSNSFLNNASKNSTEKSLGKHWSRISDFSLGDIKGVWEIGRFAWVYPLIAAYCRAGDEKYAESFWLLVEDWAEKNPPNLGVHWKCGQEIAIRMFALVSGYFAFTASAASTETRKRLAAEILHRSAERIEANIGYALSQKNNHGISEAAGLFTAGLIFERRKWTLKGRKLLERQTRELIYDDGSFSQHSLNYHRVMLQVLLWAVQLGRRNGIGFSTGFLGRVRRAGWWLLSMTDPETGRVPNLGANDGALVFPVTDCDYLDYRPTVQAVGAVIDGVAWIPTGPWDAFARWLGAECAGPGDIPETREIRRHIYHKNGGYSVFRNGKSSLFFRCPEQFVHRPSQCDLLHVDLWHNGMNLLRDGGSFSYNCKSPWQEYFKSVSAHNTIQFDGHDQMPGISRFLYGNWPSLTIDHTLHDETSRITAKYRDWKGCRHSRSIDNEKNGYRVMDLISDFDEYAVLRWRLTPDVEWILTDGICRSPLATIAVSVDPSKAQVKMKTGWESLYYLEKSCLPVLEVTVPPAEAAITTTISFNP